MSESGSDDEAWRAGRQSTEIESGTRMNLELGRQSDVEGCPELLTDYECSSTRNTLKEHRDKQVYHE